MADRATITKLDSLRSNGFDTVWLQSMISRDEGAIEMASTETANGRNRDAIGLARQIVAARRAEVGQMTQILGG